MKVGIIYPNKWTHEPSYQMISRWFSQWATSKHFWILWNVILIAALPQSKSSFFCGNPSLIYLCTNRPFGFSTHASLFLGCFFFIFFYCFTTRFKTWTLFKMNENFYFPKEENSLAQIPAFDPNGLSKYVT